VLIGSRSSRPPPPARPGAAAAAPAAPAPPAPPAARPEPGASGAYTVGYAPADAPLDRLAVFLASWREHSPGARVALLLPPARLADAATAALLAELGAEGVPFDAPLERDGPTKSFIMFSASYCASKFLSLGLFEFVGGPAEGLGRPHTWLKHPRPALGGAAVALVPDDGEEAPWTAAAGAAAPPAPRARALGVRAVAPAAAAAAL
jgi:hypothetical protein